MPSLEGARIKLARALRHMDELRGEARAYLESSPYQLRESEEPNGDLVYRLQMVRSIPSEWAAIVGDAVHNMRAGLDLLAWQLVERNGGQPTRDTCFPIGPTAPAYDPALRRALAGAHPAALRMIRRLRPYPGGNTFLTQLHALDIVDKHRLILIVGAAHKHLVLKMKMNVPWQPSPVEFPPLALNPADRQFPLADGPEVFRVMAAARTGELRPDHQLVFELAFGDVSEVRGLPLVATLEAMHKHVSRVVEIATRRFFS